jgi:hypothetical protein
VNAYLGAFVDETFQLTQDLRDELRNAGRMFEAIRYFYERADLPHHWYLSPLPDILRNRIVDLRPDWADNSYLVSMREVSEEFKGYPFTVYGIAPVPPKPDK